MFLSRWLAARLPFYYGWVMLPVAVVAAIVLSPGQTYAVAEFKSSLLHDLQLSETKLSGAYMVATFLAGFTAIVAGAAMDRFGLRRTITVAVVMLGVSCVFASQVTNMVTLFVAFLLLRVMGHGALPLLTSNVLAMWFRRRLGFVTGLFGVLSAAVTAGVPALYLWLISAVGWRSAWGVLGVAVCAVMLPVMALVFRNRPDDVGQALDGDVTDAVTDACQSRDILKSSVPNAEAVSFDPRAARRTRTFWLLLALHAAHGMIFAAVMFHRVQIFEDQGMTARESHAMFATFAIAVAAGQLLAGLIADRVPLRLLLTVSSVGVTAAVVVLTQMSTLTMAYAFGVMYGLSTGAEIVGRQITWPIYFGTKHLGKLKGFSAMSAVCGSSLGPFALGWSFDNLGGFGPALWCLAGVYAVIAMLMPMAAQPRVSQGA